MVAFLSLKYVLPITDLLHRLSSTMPYVKLLVLLPFLTACYIMAVSVVLTM